jgi:pantoate--beta-alanine ligase
MKNVRMIDELREAVRASRASEERIGLVPTMGFFHEGHLSLMRRAVEENDIVVVSVFVNPRQFGPGEDFERYPRDPERDEALAKREGVHYLFSPPEEEMYPGGYMTAVEVKGLSGKLCGKTRPGHFSGVATVVAKLLNVCSPDSLYLGQKDAQQAVILKRMVNDLNMDVHVEIMPTVREEDGLAMSSRNRYLSPDERAQAPAFYRALLEAKQLAEEKGGSVLPVLEKFKNRLASAGGMELEYVELVSCDKLEPLDRIEGPAVLAGAVRLGKARLIDNVLINCERL